MFVREGEIYFFPPFLTNGAGVDMKPEATPRGRGCWRALNNTPSQGPPANPQAIRLPAEQLPTSGVYLFACSLKSPGNYFSEVIILK